MSATQASQFQEKLQRLTYNLLMTLNGINLTALKSKKVSKLAEIWRPRPSVATKMLLIHICQPATGRVASHNVYKLDCLPPSQL